jgi:hypothetical protein
VLRALLELRVLLASLALMELLAQKALVTKV